MLMAAAMMFGALLLVLLLACANLGNLLLAKAAARGREISVRLSLGATRRRVVRQLLTESMVLALIAGTSGLLLATQFAPFLRRLSGSGESMAVGARPDWVVLGGTFVVAALACLAFGLAPALHAARTPLVDALKGRDHGDASTAGYAVFSLGSKSRSRCCFSRAPVFSCGAPSRLARSISALP